MLIGDGPLESAMNAGGGEGRGKGPEEGSALEVRRVEGSKIDHAYRVRHQVFVEEQGISAAIERDEHDAEAIHVVAYFGGRPVGAGRLVVGAAGGKIGRMAVLEPFRNRGIGGRILEALVAEARSQGCSRAYLHAQLPARSFYEKRGFSVTGAVFQEAGLDHVAMERAL